MIPLLVVVASAYCSLTMNQGKRRKGANLTRQINRDSTLWSWIATTCLTAPTSSQEANSPYHVDIPLKHPLDIMDQKKQKPDDHDKAKGNNYSTSFLTITSQV